MTVAEFKPCESLKPYVSHYRIISSTDGCVNKILPSTSIAMAICIEGEVKIQTATHALTSKLMISGLRKSARVVEYIPGSSALIISFTPTGAAAFIQAPLQELFGQSVALDNIFSSNETTALHDLISLENDNAGRIKVVEHFLLKKKGKGEADLLVKEAVRQIIGAKGVLQIKDLCRKFCISPDAFEKRFRRTTGTTPKQFAVLTRISNITKMVNPPGYMDLAISNGYYDQAHFNKEFKSYTGVSPSEFFSTRRPW